MRINQNIMAFNAYRNLTATNVEMGKSLEKLSSGFRINRAADDASGLVISQGLRAQVSGLRQATRNAQDGISVVQTAEGALGEVHSMLNRMRDLIIQAANTGSGDAAARAAAQNEIKELQAEIDRIANSTSFGNRKLLNGSFGVQNAAYSTNVASTTLAAGYAVGTGGASLSIGVDGATAVSVTVAEGNYKSAASLQAAIQEAIDGSALKGKVEVAVRDQGDNFDLDFVRADADAGSSVAVASTGLTGVTGGSATAVGSAAVFQVGANVVASEQIRVSGTDIRITGGTIGYFTDLAKVNATDGANAALHQARIDNAINAVSRIRGKLGAVQNRFESTIANLQVGTENLAASESRIRDTDMALEMVTFTRNQILLQAGTAMLAQANAVPQSVLRLLQ
jgi:flagellin